MRDALVTARLSPLGCLDSSLFFGAGLSSDTVAYHGVPLTDSLSLAIRAETAFRLPEGEPSRWFAALVVNLRLVVSAWPVSSPSRRRLRCSGHPIQPHIPCWSDRASVIAVWFGSTRSPRASLCPLLSLCLWPQAIVHATGFPWCCLRWLGLGVPVCSLHRPVCPWFHAPG
jgi:hypothetical protein